MTDAAANENRRSVALTTIPVALLAKFDDLCAKTTEDQTELFLTSFIFELGDDWKKVIELGDAFRRYLFRQNQDHDLNPVEAADFLQHQGRTRTGMERKAELLDIDLNFDGRICFIEYLLLHFKPLILRTYYKRMEKVCPHDLSSEGVGVTGVGLELLDELFHFPPGGLPAELKKALEDFFAAKRARQERMDSLREKSKLSGVKGLTAKNELLQMEAKDTTDMNRLEITLQAAKRKAIREGGSSSSADALKAEKEKSEAEEKKKRLDSRSRLAARAAMFESKGC